MLKHFFSLYIFIFCLPLSYFIIAHQKHPELNIPPAIRIKNLSDKAIKFGNFGFKRLWSSTLWINTLLEANKITGKVEVQNYSWLFFRFKSISDLEPLFLENYIVAGLILSVSHKDYKGATQIYKRGLTHYPHQFELMQGLLFHILINHIDEEEKIKNELLSQLIKEKKASPLVLKIFFNQNKSADFSLDVLREIAHNHEPESIIGKMLQKKIDELEQKHHNDRK